MVWQSRGKRRGEKEKKSTEESPWAKKQKEKESQLLRFSFLCAFLTNALVLRLERKEERGRAPIGPEMGKRGRASRDAGTRTKKQFAKAECRGERKDVEGRARQGGIAGTRPGHVGSSGGRRGGAAVGSGIT